MWSCSSLYRNLSLSSFLLSSIVGSYVSACNDCTGNVLNVPVYILISFLCIPSSFRSPREKFKHLTGLFILCLLLVNNRYIYKIKYQSTMTISTGLKKIWTNGKYKRPPTSINILLEWVSCYLVYPASKSSMTIRHCLRHADLVSYPSFYISSNISCFLKKPHHFVHFITLFQ